MVASFFKPGHALLGYNWMGDHLCAGKQSWYVTSHPGQLNLSILPWVGTMRSSLWATG